MVALLLAIAAIATALVAVFMILVADERRRRRRGSLHPRRQARRTRGGWGEVMLDALLRLFQAPNAPAPAAEMTTAPAPTGPVRSDPDMPGIPEATRPKVREINELLDRIGLRIGGDPLGQPLIIEMETMRDRHLPKLLDSFRNVDERHRRAIFVQTGRSASFHLAESLDAMIRRLQEIDRDLSREDIDAFTDNAGFITRTYGQGSDPLA